MTFAQWRAAIFQGLAPRRFAADIEAIYRSRQNERALPGTRAVLIVAPITFLLFGFWDLWFDAASLARTLPVRALFCGLLLALLASTHFSFFRARLTWVLAAGALCAFVGITWVLNLMPAGMLWGLTGLAYPQMATMALPNARFSALSSVLLLLSVNVLGAIFSTPAAILANSNFLLIALCVLAYLFACSIEVRDRRLFQVEVDLEAQATTDSLSGAMNRRHFIRCAEIEFSRALRYAHPTALLMLDIDFFKAINDKHGHAVGDNAIRLLTVTCAGALRTTDSLARIGGEEFAILLPETDLQAALLVAERLRQTIADLRLPAGEKLAAVAFTVSIGVAIFQTGDDVDALLQRADVALYQAKTQGRNRVAIHQEIAEKQATPTG